MRDVGRKSWLLNTFKGQSCPCGESELVCLEWYPNHKKISSLTLRHGIVTKEREVAEQLYALKFDVISKDYVIDHRISYKVKIIPVELSD